MNEATATKNTADGTNQVVVSPTNKACIDRFIRAGNDAGVAMHYFWLTSKWERLAKRADASPRES